MFSGLTYFFDHSIYFARLCHVNPLCKHEYAFLQMKEAPNQKVQEKKPLLKFKNTKKYMCLERIWRKKCFWACRHRPLIYRLKCSKCQYVNWNVYKFWVKVKLLVTTSFSCWQSWHDMSNTNIYVQVTYIPQIVACIYPIQTCIL